MEDTGTVHVGHYELFGHHYEYVINFGRLFAFPSPHREEILRATEAAVVNRAGQTAPTALVLYPDFGTAHVLAAAVERRHRIARTVAEGKLAFLEARRGFLARGLTYWLTKQEIRDARKKAERAYPDGYRVVILDDGASTGHTQMALTRLARKLGPREVAAFVVVNRMPSLLCEHLTEVEALRWARYSFSSMLQLEIPVYEPSTCPACRERTELLRERRHGRQAWYTDQLDTRLRALETTCALHPDDRPDEQSTKRLTLAAFSWEDHKTFPGPAQTVASRAMAALVAIGRGVKLMQILGEISECDDVLWSLCATEVARCVEIQQAQQCEADVRDYLIRMLEVRPTTRGAAALDALRQLRPEVLLPVTVEVVHATLTNEYSDGLLASLLLFLRRVFSYRHFDAQEIFDLDLAVMRVVDSAAAEEGPMTERRMALDGMKNEWGHGPERGLSAPSIIRQLESILRTQRRPEHWFLNELAEYIADSRSDFDGTVVGAVDQAVRAGALAMEFARVLAPFDEEVRRVSEKAYQHARSLSLRVRGHMRNTEKQEMSELREQLDELYGLCEAIGRELETRFADLGDVVRSSHSAWENGRDRLGIADARVSVDIQARARPPILVDRALVTEITRNLFSNLRHSVDRDGGRLVAAITVREATAEGGERVVLRVQCATSGSQSPSDDGDPSTIVTQAREAGIYGANHRVLSSGPWCEEWTFWRL